jgi:hypothetical protein
MQLASAVVAAAAVRLAVVSGTPQSAHAYVAPAARVYLTEFRQPLIVRVAGRGAERIRFSCANPHCVFPPSDQPDQVHRINESTYDVDVHDGKAELTLTLSTVTLGTFIVTARVADAHSPAGTVRFALTAR